MSTPEDTVWPRLLRARAQDAPERPFLWDIGEEPRTLGQAAGGAQRWTGALAALGVAAGDYVAAMLPNSVIAVELFFGINGLGAIEVPIHNDYRGRFLAHVLNTAPARVIVIHERFVDRLAEIAHDLPALRTVVVVGDTGTLREVPFEVHGAAALLAGASLIEPTDETLPRDPCMVMFTSGTTGVSKGVLVSYAHMGASTEGAWPHRFLGPEDVNYLVLPLYHISGKVAISSMLLSGGRAVIRERFKTGEFWNDVRATSATCACMMGAMGGFLMAQPSAPDDAENSMDKVLMLPLPPFLEEFRERFGVRVRTIYNQTETSCPIVSDGFTTGHYTSCGRVREGCEVRLVDGDDAEVPAGEVGELIVRTAEPWTMMSGYVGMPDKTVEAWRNQWMHTGDAFKVDGEGNYYFVDRFKDMIRRRGENISSVEVEISICEHPDVIECAAIPVESDWSEQEVKVAVVRRAGSELSAPALVEYLAGRVPQFMIPRYVEFLAELPKTPTQKVRKTELRELGVTAATWDREAAKSHART